MLQAGHLVCLHDPADASPPRAIWCKAASLRFANVKKRDDVQRERHVAFVSRIAV